ncbi:MAG: DUF2007 domain-containing protein [Bacteroidota bacterium]
MELITLKTFNSIIEAHVLKSKLESEDIHCFLKDETMMGINPLFNISLGGVKLMINKEDSEKALEILKQIESSEDNYVD